MDGYGADDNLDLLATYVDSLILNVAAQGASASRNIGAASIVHRRHGAVMFVDDDCWFAPNYDQALLLMARALPHKTIISPYGHPFNVEEPKPGIAFAKFPLVISSVAMLMSWQAFDSFGPFDLPGGAGRSEDYSLCMRAKKEGYEFAVSNPHAAIHCGMFSSNGEKIVGYEQLAEQNSRLLDLYKVRGKVQFG
jgi:GT2 family glycosyltransferase